MSTNAAKSALLNALHAIGEAHEFAVSGSLDLVLPGLRVEGVGEIGLPVAPDDARALIGVAERAPFGRGEETVVDPAVRSVWQIGPERVAFGNPKWKGLVTSVVRTVKEAFAIRRPIQARLYKLLVYETGSHFAAHKDSEKEDGMFATLVVYLPSRHAGGRLVVRHAGAEKAFDLDGQTSSYMLQYAAFYTDCEHEIEPLKDGFRVALVYNLLLANAKASVAAPEYSKQTAAVSAALARLFEDEAMERVAIGLQHEYSEAGLAPSRLKGADRPRFHALAQAAAERDYECSLALMTHYQVGEAEEDSLYGRASRGRGRRGWWGGWSGDWDDLDVDDEDLEGVEIAEVYEESWGLEHWVAVDGRPRDLSRMELSPDELVRDPKRELSYEQSVQGPTGNEGISVERWYRQAVVVLWPRSNYVDLLAREGPAFAVPALAAMIESSDDPSADPELLRFATAILDQWGRRLVYTSRTDDAVVIQMLDSLAHLTDAELAGRFIRQTVVDAVNAQTATGLLALCNRLGWTSCQDPLVEMVAAQAEPDRFPEVAGLVALLEELCVADGPMTEPRRSVCSAMMEAFARVAAALDDRSPTDWRNRPVLERRDVLAPTTIALRAIDRLDLFAGFVDRALADPERYDLRDVLVPAALALHAKDATLDADPAARRLRQHVVAELRAATASRPTEPTDWHQDVDLRHACADCLELAAFARDREAHVHRFKAGKERRRHLHQQISALKLDMTHVTEREGRPFTLVCTKTRDTYKRAVAQHEADLRSLQVLAVGGAAAQ